MSNFENNNSNANVVNSANHMPNSTGLVWNDEFGWLTPGQLSDLNYFRAKTLIQARIDVDKNTYMTMLSERAADKRREKAEYFRNGKWNVVEEDGYISEVFEVRGVRDKRPRRLVNVRNLKLTRFVAPDTEEFPELYSLEFDDSEYFLFSCKKLSGTELRRVFNESNVDFSPRTGAQKESAERVLAFLKNKLNIAEIPRCRGIIRNQIGDSTCWVCCTSSVNFTDMVRRATYVE